MTIMKHNEVKRSRRIIGIEGENIARQFFESIGFEILETNWRHRHQEIDIIATDGKSLHIIEVKTQTSETGGFPEESVDRKEMLNIIKAAEAYMNMNTKWNTLQFDILSILLKNGEPEILWIEDVYL